MTKRPNYDRALAALQAAHDACYKDKTRDVLGMSHGPFSGVNEALGIIATLEAENQSLRRHMLEAIIAAHAAGDDLK